MNEISNLNIEEGSISFWTKANQINWPGNDVVTFFEKSFEANSIFILKDSDSKLKFFHIYFGKGRTNVELDVKDLNISERHFVVATWSTNSKEISLYVDGNIDGSKLAKKQKINY